MLRLNTRCNGHGSISSPGCHRAVAYMLRLNNIERELGRLYTIGADQVHVDSRRRPV